MEQKTRSELTSSRVYLKDKDSPLAFGSNVQIFLQIGEGRRGGQLNSKTGESNFGKFTVDKIPGLMTVINEEDEEEDEENYKNLP